MDRNAQFAFMYEHIDVIVDAIDSGNTYKNIIKILNDKFKVDIKYAWLIKFCQSEIKVLPLTSRSQGKFKDARQATYFSVNRYRKENKVETPFERESFDNSEIEAVENKNVPQIIENVVLEAEVLDPQTETEEKINKIIQSDNSIKINFEKIEKDIEREPSLDLGPEYINIKKPQKKRRGRKKKVEPVEPISEQEIIDNFSVVDYLKEGVGWIKKFFK